MPKTRARTLERLFDLAADLPAEQRRPFLENECGGDHDLLRVALALFEADGRSTGALHEALRFQGPSTYEELIADYRIEGLLGRGGMGEVFLASHPRIDRKVAIKVMAALSQTPDMEQRFEQEREIHAQLEHPGIARLYDSGKTKAGAPYLVMELVEGMPLTTYCRMHGLSVDERLALLRDACDAVSAAHQRLVLHRDLKPSNILVCSEPRGQVKLLDFGLAKYLAPGAGHLTDPGQAPMTRAYAAPEQYDGRALDLRTDVYALGVVLYELLTGTVAYDVAELSFEQARAVVGAGATTPPSERFEALAISERPAIHPRSWRDLDTICLKAIAVDPRDRYASVGDLRRDLEHYLANEILDAKPTTGWEKLVRFIARNRLYVGVSVLALSTLLAFTSVLLLQHDEIAAERDRANQEADAAEQVVTFLTDVMESASPDQALGSQVGVLEVLDRAAAAIQGDLRSQPNVKARLLHVMGSVYHRLGRYEEANGLLAQALEARRQALGPETSDTLETRSRYAHVLLDQGKLSEARVELEQTLELQERVAGRGELTTVLTRSRLAQVLFRLRLHDRALELFEEVARERNRLLGAHHPTAINSLLSLAVAQSGAGRYAEAEPLFLEALALAKEHLPLNHPTATKAVHNLAGLYLLLERFEDAEPMFRESVVAHTEVRGPSHLDTLRAKIGLGLAQKGLGHPQEARDTFEEVIAMATSALGAEHLLTLSTRFNLAELLSSDGHYEAAEPHYESAVAGFRSKLGQTHRYVALGLQGLATLYRKTGRLERSEEAFAAAREVLEAELGSDHALVADNLEAHAEVLRELGALAAAESLTQRVAAIRGALEKNAHE